jgi:pimeloyl-ACP methyl ester carboxylesterase
MKFPFLTPILPLFLFAMLHSRAANPVTDPSTAPPSIASFQGTDDMWQGFKRHSFTVDGCKCWIAEPKTPLAGNHWAWCMMFPDAFPARTGAPALLAKGYYYVFMDVGNTFGAPSALAKLSAFYNALTGAGFNSKAILIGISRGGAYACNWAAQNPEKVSLIYGDAPVCSFASWPYAHGAGKDSRDWKKLLAVYGFKTNQEAVSCPTQPINEVAQLVKAHIPLLCVVGDADTTVPYSENTAIVEQKYKKLGGQITVIHKPGCGHHPHGLDDPTPIVDFVMQHDH